MTGEGEEDTDAWVEKQGAQYAYAYDRSRALSEFFGVRGIPTAVLIDPDGEILWRGHPSTLSKSTIKKGLKGAQNTRLWNAIFEGDYKAALDAAEKLKGDEKDRFDGIIRGALDDAVGRMKGAVEVGDWLTAYELSDSLKDGLKGLPEGDDAAALHDKIKADKEAQAIIDVQEDIAKLAIKVKECEKKKDAEKLIPKAEKLQAKLPGSYAEKQANKLLEQLKILKVKLKR